MSVCLTCRGCARLVQGESRELCALTELRHQLQDLGEHANRDVADQLLRCLIAGRHRQVAAQATEKRP